MSLSNIGRFGLALGLGAACAAAPEASAADTICPDSIEVTQSLTTGRDGWESALAAGPSRLKAVGFYDGHPREQVMLAPDTTDESPTVYALTWHFAGVAAVWLECGYDQTSVVLRKRLDRGVAGCSVALVPDVFVGGMPLIRNVECR